MCSDSLYMGIFAHCPCVDAVLHNYCGKVDPSLYEKLQKEIIYPEYLSTCFSLYTVFMIFHLVDWHFREFFVNSFCILSAGYFYDSYIACLQSSFSTFSLWEVLSHFNLIYLIVVGWKKKKVNLCYFYCTYLFFSTWTCMNQLREISFFPSAEAFPYYSWL